MNKFLLIKTVPNIYIEPPYEYEVTDEEFKEWKEAHHFQGAVANSCMNKILQNMIPGETLAETSARLGYGNTDDEDTRKWYYDHHVYILNEQAIS